MDEEIIEINGIKYKPSQWDGDKHLESVKGQETTAKIACIKCHNTEFQISYGRYECIATCKCGNSMVVYSG